MATWVSGTPKSLEIRTISSEMKSKASRVHPSQAATQASHSSLVGSSTMELELYWPLPLI